MITQKEKDLRKKLLNPKLNYYERLKIRKMLGIKKFSNKSNRWK